MEFRLALAGNPNCGKTTLFNAVTGSAQYVGNWPGVTVEKKEGRFSKSGMDITLVDLPGIYSLSPYTPEEIVSRKYLTEECPDLIINIVDATNLERNLYLTTQLAELGRPMIIALNMIDRLKKRGKEIDIKRLEDELGIPVCPISASKEAGIEELLHRSIHILHDVAHSENEKIEKGFFKNRAEELHDELHRIHEGLNDNENVYYPIVKSFYEWQINSAIEGIEGVICDNAKAKHNLRFSAVKLFEDDFITKETLNLDNKSKKLVEEILKSVPESENIDRQMMIADSRYKFICRIVKEVESQKKGFEETISDKIDKILTHRVIAIPMFFLIIFTIFGITFGSFGSMLTDFVDKLINQDFAGFLRESLLSVNTKPWAVSLLCDGMLAGVGAVVSFLPQIALLFFFLSILEDSGYMSRAAFIMDGPLRKVGLTGRSFMPMLMGFGCTVPAVLGTRILENERDKKLTVFLIPFMSCSAKMPVYALFISAFFEENKPLIIFTVYILGILLGILSGFILKKTVLKGEESTFVMELPEYSLPTVKNLFIHVWERLKDFLLKAGTVLLAASVVIWFLQSFDTSLRITDNPQASLLAKIGILIAPVFAPLGFGNWQSSVALLSGVVAKETVVSTFGILFSAADETSRVLAVQGLFSSPLAAFSFIVFVLLYTPCIAAVAAIHKELGGVKWTVLSVVWQIATAWLVSFLVFNIGGAIL